LSQGLGEQQSSSCAYMLAWTAGMCGAAWATACHNPFSLCWALVVSPTHAMASEYSRCLKVDDDLETRYLRAQKAELSFSLDVPGKVGVHSTCMPSITYCLAALLICCIQHLFMLLIRPHAVVCAAVPLACMCPAPGESSSSVSTFPHCRARCVVCYTTSRMRTTERRCPWRHQQRQQPLGPSAALACEGASHRQDHPRWA